MELTKNKIKLWDKVIKDLRERGAKVKVVCNENLQFYIDAKWKTGRHWKIGKIEVRNG